MVMAFFDAMLRHPWRLLLLTLLVLVASFLGLKGLSSSNDYRSFLDDDYPGMLELAEVEDLFAENKAGLILISTEQGDLFNPKSLLALRDLTDALWQTPRLKRVDSIANFQNTRADEDDLYVEDLIPLDEPLSPSLIKIAKSVSLSDPALRDLLISADGSVAAISLIFEFNGADALDQSIRDDTAHFVFNLLEDYRAQYPELGFHETGSFFADYYSDHFLQEINTHLLPLMLLLMMVLLALLLRSITDLLAASFVVVGSGIITMGVFGWSNMVLEAVAAMGPIVIMTLAVADSVHVIVGAQAAYGRGMQKTEAIKESLRINFMPIFLTSLTTALGVITFVFTDFPSLRKLGVIIAFGVTVAFVLSVTILPVLLQWLPMRARKESNTIWYARLSRFVIRRCRLILPIALIVSLVIASAIRTATVDESFQNLFKPHTEIAQSIALSDEKLAGLLQLDVAVFADQPQALADPAFLQTLEDFRLWVLQRENVTHVATITDTLKRLNRSMNANQESAYKLPDSKELAAQYMLLYEMSLPYGLDLQHQTTMDKSATRMSVSARDVRSARVLKLSDDIRDWFASNAPQYRVIVTSVVGLMSEVTMYELVPNMMRGAVLAILMVSLVLFFALRSWLLGALGMLANIVPIAVGYGIWALSGQLYNFVVISVAGICLGMVVDFAVHFLDKFRVAYDEYKDAEAAVRYAYQKTASPIVITAVVLMAGFFVLSFTKTATFTGLGLLTPLIIGLTVIFDLLVMPALIIVICQIKNRRRGCLQSK